MLDTVKLKIPISIEDFKKIVEQPEVTQTTNQKTGEIISEYYKAQTHHPYNYIVAYKISDEYWECPGSISHNIGSFSRTYPHPEKGIPHVTVEFSVPKILWGRNLLSAGVELLYPAISVVKRAFEDKYGCILPNVSDWYCFRIDTCANYVLSDELQVESYIALLSRLDYPRRKPNIYGNSGLRFPSRQSTLKVYAKGQEFEKHEKNRFANSDLYEQLSAEASRILRVEVEFKRQLSHTTQKYNDDELYLNVLGKEKLETFQGYPKIGDLLSVFNCKTEMERVVQRLLSGTQSRVTTTRAAENLIRSHCSQRQASAFVAAYYSIVSHGQAYAKETYGPNIYYRALKLFRQIGISLLPEDKPTGELGFPEDFRLDMDTQNPYYQRPIKSLTEIPPETTQRVYSPPVRKGVHPLLKAFDMPQQAEGRRKF